MNIYIDKMSYTSQFINATTNKPIINNFSESFTLTYPYGGNRSIWQVWKPTATTNNGLVTGNTNDGSFTMNKPGIYDVRMYWSFAIGTHNAGDNVTGWNRFVYYNTNSSQDDLSSPQMLGLSGASLSASRDNPGELEVHTGNTGIYYWKWAYYYKTNNENDFYQNTSFYSGSFLANQNDKFMMNFFIDREYITTNYANLIFTLIQEI